MPPTESSAIRSTRVSPTSESMYVPDCSAQRQPRASWRQVAMETGHPVVVVRDGEEAQLQITTRGVPVLLVTELSLPKLDPFTLIRNLRQLPRGETTSVIAISAFQPLRAAAKELGQSLNFAKILPADVDQSALRAAIQALVGIVNDAPRRRPGPPPAPAASGQAQASIMSMVARQVVEAALQFNVETCAGLITLGADEPLASVYSSNPRLLGTTSRACCGTWPTRASRSSSRTRKTTRCSPTNGPIPAASAGSRRCRSR